MIQFFTICCLQQKSEEKEALLWANIKETKSRLGISLYMRLFLGLGFFSELSFPLQRKLYVKLQRNH
jgi:hypothetical protein